MTDAEQAMHRGLALVRAGDLDLGIAELTRALDLGLDRDEPPSERGKIVPLFQHATALNERGVAYLLRGELDAAERDFDAALRHNADEHIALGNRAVVRRRRGDFAAALLDLDRALFLRPDFADALVNRGNVRLDLGDPAAAIADFERALALRPEIPNAREGLARAVSANEARSSGSDKESDKLTLPLRSR